MIDSTDALVCFATAIGMKEEEIVDVVREVIPIEEVGVHEYITRAAEGHDKKSMLIGAMLVIVAMEKVV